MKTHMASSSLQAYREIREEGLLTKRQQQVMDVIQAGRDYSLQEISLLSGLPINVVSGRVNELKSELQCLEVAPARKCTLTGRTIHPVRRPAKQGALF